MKYAYIGEATEQEYKKISNVFPYVREIGTMKANDGTELVCLGVDDSFPDDVIGLYQLIITLWGDDDARERAWDSVFGSETVYTENAILRLRIKQLEAKLSNISKVLNALEI